MSNERSQVVQEDQQYLWHPFTQMKGWLEYDQMTIVGGEGVYLIDDKGNKYYDGVSSLWVNIHGHRVPELDKAITDQLEKIAHSTLLGLISPPSVELAKRLVAITPKSLEKVFFSDDGSTGIEVAIKMAYQYWALVGRREKREFITLTSAYHGDTLGTVSVGGIDAFHKIFQDLLFHPNILHSPGIYDSVQEKEAIAEKSLEALASLLKEKSNSIAALIIEPLVQAAAGMRTMPHGYLKRVRELTKKYDVLLIVDEVATGFGRTGTMFACEQEDVDPDLMILSKGITGGYLPLAATLTTTEIFNAFLGELSEGKTFYHGHSYTGNALACAVGIASLDLFEKNHIIEGLQEKIPAVTEALKEIEKLPHVKEVRQQGLMIGIDIVQDVEKNIPYYVEDAMGAKAAFVARKHGLIVRPIGDAVILLPPLASTKEQLLDMVRILRDAIQYTTENPKAEALAVPPTTL